MPETMELFPAANLLQRPSVLTKRRIIQSLSRRRGNGVTWREVTQASTATRRMRTRREA